MFFFPLKNNKAGLYLRGSSDHRLSLLLPTLLLLVCSKGTYGPTGIFPEKFVFSREMKSRLKFLGKKKPRFLSISYFLVAVGRESNTRSLSSSLGSAHPCVRQGRWTRVRLSLLIPMSRPPTPLHWPHHLWSPCRTQHGQPLCLDSTLHDSGQWKFLFRHPQTSQAHTGTSSYAKGKS